jgi:hypothetical protein
MSLADMGLLCSVLMRGYQKAIERGDPNVYLLDGASIFAGAEYDACR